MTDEIKETLTTRVDRINEAVRQLSATAYNAIIATAKPKTDAENVDIVNTIQALGVLVGSVVVALSEIADSVGKLARQSEADINAAVDDMAARKAAVIHEEQNKRSFIGQPRKGS